VKVNLEINPENSGRGRFVFEDGYATDGDVLLEHHNNALLVFCNPHRTGLSAFCLSIKASELKGMGISVEDLG